MGWDRRIRETLIQLRTQVEREHGGTKGGVIDELVNSNKVTPSEKRGAKIYARGRGGASTRQIDVGCFQDSIAALVQLVTWVSFLCLAYAEMRWNEFLPVSLRLPFTLLSTAVHPCARE